MGAAPPTYRNKARIVQALKEGGDVEDVAANRASMVLWERMGGQDAISRSVFSSALKTLDDEGVVEREFSSHGNGNPTRIRAIRLLNRDTYDDPDLIPLPQGGTGVVDLTMTPTRPMGRPKGKSLERIYADIERLPLSERLMLAGMIIDEAAGDMEEREIKLREALTGLL